MDLAGPDTRDRRAEVERVFFDMGWEDIDGIEDWDGSDLEALAEILLPDQYETLIDELADRDAFDL